MNGELTMQAVESLSEQGIVVHICYTTHPPFGHPGYDENLRHLDIALQQAAMEDQPCLEISQTLELPAFTDDESLDTYVAGVIHSLGRLLVRRLLTPEELTPALSEYLPDDDPEPWEDHELN